MVFFSCLCPPLLDLFFLPGHLWISCDVQFSNVIYVATRVVYGFSLFVCFTLLGVFGGVFFIRFLVCCIFAVWFWWQEPLS